MAKAEYAELKELALWLEGVTANPLYDRYVAIMRSKITAKRDEIIHSEDEEHKITKKRGWVGGMEECLHSFLDLIKHYGTEGTVKEPETS